MNVDAIVSVSRSGPNPLLCTVFSASDYGGAGNSAAYLAINVLPRQTQIEGEEEKKADESEEGGN